VTPSRLPRRAHHRDPRPGPQALGDLDQLGRAGGGVDAAGDDRLRRRARLGGVHRRPRDALTQSLCSPDSTMTTGAPVDTRRAPMPSYILMRDGICSQHDPWTYGTSPPAARQRDREGGADRHCAGAHGPRRRDSPRPGSGLTEEHLVSSARNTGRPVSSRSSEPLPALSSNEAGITRASRPGGGCPAPRAPCPRRSRPS